MMRAARRAPTSAPSRFTFSTACQPGPVDSTKSPAISRAAKETAITEFIFLKMHKLGVLHAGMPSARAVTSLIYAGVQQRNVDASMQPHVLSKERFLCCVISNVALHWPRLPGVAGAQARSFLCSA